MSYLWVPIKGPSSFCRLGRDSPIVASSRPWLGLIGIRRRKIVCVEILDAARTDLCCNGRNNVCIKRCGVWGTRIQSFPFGLAHSLGVPVSMSRKSNIPLQRNISKKRHQKLNHSNYTTTLIKNLAVVCNYYISLGYLQQLTILGFFVMLLRSSRHDQSLIIQFFMTSTMTRMWLEVSLVAIDT